MNLFTTQQDNPTARLVNSREPIIVNMPKWPGGGTITCKYGTVATPYTKFHECITDKRVYRPCVHALESPPPVTLWSIDDTLQLGWQPRIITHWANPCIAARRNDVVTVAFDCIGEMAGCKNQPTKLPEQHRWSYKLFPFIWSDVPGKVESNVWLGVWND